MQRLMLLLSITALSAIAQDFQPVAATCSNSVSAGSIGNSGGSCSTYVLAGSPVGTTVPPGKLLIIEDVSVLCTKNSADFFSGVTLGGDGNGQPSYQKDIPLMLRVVHANGNQTWRGSITSRYYLPPNEPIKFKVIMGAAATSMANCQASFSGQLVPYTP